MWVNEGEYPFEIVSLDIFVEHLKRSNQIERLIYFFENLEVFWFDYKYFGENFFYDLSAKIGLRNGSFSVQNLLHLWKESVCKAKPDLTQLFKRIYVSTDVALDEFQQ